MKPTHLFDDHIARELHRARHGAATMRKYARIYAEGGAEWLAHDAERRARYLSRRARSLARQFRIIRAIATKQAVNHA